jgi:hypothetical protein
MNETRLIYDYLFSLNLSEDRIEEEIIKYDRSKLINLITKLNDLVPKTEYAERSSFNLIANTSLSGAPSQCTNFDCRTNNLAAFIRKSILYADKVWIKYPLDKYNEYHLESSNLEDLKYNLIHDLIITHQVRSLIYSGIFQFSVSKKHFCFECFGSLSDEVDWPMVHEVKVLKSILKETYANGANYKIKRDGTSKWKLVITAKNNNLFYHPELYYKIEDVSKEFPKSLMRYSKLVKPEEVIQSKQINKLVNLVIENIVMQNWYSENIGANYVTNIPIELTSAKIISNDIREINFNYDGLEHQLPTIAKVPISKLLELRENEPEAFVNYRNSFDHIMTKAKSLELVDQQQLIRSELQPVINQLNQNIKSNRDKLIKGTLHSLVVGSSLVAVSVFPGLLPVGFLDAHIVATGAGVGALHESKEFLKGVKGLVTKEYEEKNNKYYFLWKSLN